MFVFFFFVPSVMLRCCRNFAKHSRLLTSRSRGKRESCVSSTTTTTVLVGPVSSYAAVHHRGDVNGISSGGCGFVGGNTATTMALPMSAMPRAISPLMKVRCCFVCVWYAWRARAFVWFDSNPLNARSKRSRTAKTYTHNETYTNRYTCWRCGIVH